MRTVCKPRPALADAPEPLLDDRQQLIHDSVSPRSERRGVDGVGIVKVRAAMLHLHHEESREVCRCPLLVEIVLLLLLDKIVADNPCPHECF